MGDRRLMLALAAVLALVVFGCGDEDSEPASESPEAGAPATDSDGSGYGAGRTPSDEGAGDGAIDGEPPPATREVTELTGFRSPSDNIGCFIEPRRVRCDIEERDWEPPDAPASCEFEYGRGIELRAGAAPDFVCANDTTLHAGEPLPYGDSIAAGLLRCESSEAGMTCTDIESARGFSLARAAYELF